MATKRVSREVRQQQRNKRMIAVFLSALMILSVAGIIAGNLSSGTTSVSEQYGIVYLSQPNSLNQQVQMIQDEEVYNFWYYPEDAMNIQYESIVLDKIKNAGGIVLLFDPLMNQQNLIYLDMVRFDMGKIWTERFNKNLGFGLSQNDTNAVYDFPVLNCTEANEYNVVIEFVQNDEELKIEQGDSPYCIMVHGYEQDFLRVRDLFVYYYLGVF